MPIDFHAQENRYTYTGREADQSWREVIKSLVDPVGTCVVDIGCGGGIYTRAWSELGAEQVIGIDFSAQMVQAASEATGTIRNIMIRLGNATATGLENGRVDIVFARAIIHHLPELNTSFQEAKRILRANGAYIIQDRTREDVQIGGSPQHLRGYFFECFPRLLEVEEQRRPNRHEVERELQEAGFASIQSRVLWETRRVYVDQNELADDLRLRSGRSILHELTDTELRTLISYIRERLPANQPVIERDRWTIWYATQGA